MLMKRGNDSIRQGILYGASRAAKKFEMIPKLVSHGLKGLEIIIFHDPMDKRNLISIQKI
jgi:hypothetical protein